jgi:hypothetical protein
MAGFRLTAGCEHVILATATSNRGARTCPDFDMLLRLDCDGFARLPARQYDHG